jgi:hypothetical protein
MFLGVARASQRMEADAQPVQHEPAQHRGAMDFGDIIRRLEARDVERQQSMDDMQKMIVRMHDQHEQERREWQRECSDYKDQLFSGISTNESRLLQSLLRDGDSSGPELLSALKKLLKDKEDKAMLTESESEESCEKSLRRRANKVDGMIPEEKRFAYPNKAIKITHEDFMRTWDIEISRLMRGRPESASSQYDELRVDELQRLLKLSHKALLSVKDCSATTRRANGKVYQAIVDLVYETKAMVMCPTSRYAAASSYRQQLSESRDRERLRDDHVVRYGALVESVVQKHGQNPMSFSHSTGRQWAPRTGAFNGARRTSSGGRLSYGHQAQGTAPQQHLPTQQRAQPQQQQTARQLNYEAYTT